MSFLIFTVFLLASEKSYGFTAKVKKEESYRVLNIENLDYVDLKMDEKIKSGLKTEVLVIAFAKKDKKRFFLGKSILKMKYNLWDEDYIFKNSSQNTLSYPSLSKILHAVKNFSVVVLKSDFLKKPKGPFKVILKVLVNPIKKEKSKKIKKWLAEKNVSKANGSGGQIGLTSVFNGMVNRVVLNDLNQDVYGAAQIAEYESTNLIDEP